MSESLSYEELLERNGSLTYTNVGTSMMPLLRQGRDLFTVVPKSGRCHVGDVALFRRPPKSWVLHRVVEVLPEGKGYLILGDNCIRREYVEEDNVIGVMTGFMRDGQQHSVDDPAYRAYVRVILVTERPRVFVKRVLLALRRRISRAVRHA